MSENKTNERPFFKPGYYPDMPNEDYHGSFGYGSTTIKILSEKTKSHMDYERNNQKKMTEPLIKGQLLHAMVLEPHNIDKEFAIRPPEIKKPTSAQLNAKKPSAATIDQIIAWDKWQKDLGDRIEVNAEQLEHCTSMAESIKNHPVMGAWFDESMEGMAEQSIFYWYNSEAWDDNNDYRLMFKVRPDWVIPGHPVLFDIKTTRDASFTNFMRSAHSMMYHMSAAMYLDGSNRNKEFLDKCGVLAFNKFVWVVVENVPPYEATYYEASKDDIEEGRQLYHRLARKLDLYNRSEWKGYGERGDDGLITPAGRESELPKYGYNIV